MVMESFDSASLGKILGWMWTVVDVGDGAVSAKGSANGATGVRADWKENFAFGAASSRLTWSFSDRDLRDCVSI
jgi:hypothetical protein